MQTKKEGEAAALEKQTAEDLWRHDLLALREVSLTICAASVDSMLQAVVKLEADQARTVGKATTALRNVGGKTQRKKRTPRAASTAAPAAAETSAA